eukprot:scaffold1969_cov191-Amphora_coffeaeformis.AAC.4
MGNQEEEKPKITLLTEEQLQSAAEQIAFDLGVSNEKAMAFAKEAQEELYHERGDLCTRETVVTAADAKHLPDEDVPAKLETLEQGAKPFPGEKMVKSVVDFAKTQYEKMKN